jgi:hypothetical protein
MSSFALFLIILLFTVISFLFVVLCTFPDCLLRNIHVYHNSSITTTTTTNTNTTAAAATTTTTTTTTDIITIADTTTAVPVLYNHILKVFKYLRFLV